MKVIITSLEVADFRKNITSPLTFWFEDPLLIRVATLLLVGELLTLSDVRPVDKTARQARLSLTEWELL